jgi:Protein of unknown function (DUF1580)
MIDLRVEDPISFGQATREYATHPSAATLWRWSLKGVQGVRLETAKIGGRRYTTIEALDRFAATLTELRSTERANPSRQRQQEMADAAERARAAI